MKKYRNIIFVILFAHLVLLGMFAGNRIVDADEGFYLNASRMVGQGMSPYEDFFYTQFAGLPLTFSTFASHGWTSFYLMRGFAALAGLLSAILLTIIVYRITGDGPTAVVALFMYAFSGMSLVWHSVFKVIPFTGFFSLGTFFFWLMYKEKRQIIYIIFSGLFLSLLISFRSLFAILLPLYIISIYSLSDRNKTRNLIVFLLSLIPLSLPNMLKIFNSFEQFYYGNIFFQMTRDVNRSFFDIIYNRLYTYARVLMDPHLLIIFALAIISIVLLIRLRKISCAGDMFVSSEGMAVANLILIAVVFLIPHPMARRYVDNYLMFAIITAAFCLPHIIAYMRDKFADNRRRIIIAVVTAVYVVMIVPYAAIFIYAARAGDRWFLQHNVREVTDHMQTVASDSDTVLSEWSAFVFLTNQTPLRYTEIVGFDLNIPMEHEQYMKYNLCDRDYLREQVGQKNPKIIVVRNRTSDYLADLIENNYDRTMETDEISVYKRR